MPSEALATRFSSVAAPHLARRAPRGAVPSTPLRPSWRPQTDQFEPHRRTFTAPTALHALPPHLAPQVTLTCGATLVPPQSLLTAAATVVGGMPVMVARIAAACVAGLALRRTLARANATLEIPAEALMALTMRHRQNAINTVSAAACVLCFLLVG